MPSTTDIALLAGGGLLASEAVGITNLFGGGGSGPINIEIPSGGGGGGMGAIPVPTGGGNSPSLGASAEMLSNLGKLQGRLTGLQSQLQQQQDSFERAINQVSPYQGNQTTNPGPNNRGSDPSGPNTTRPDSSVTNRQLYAERQGRDPFGLQATDSGWLGKGAEGLRATGETATDVVNSVGRPGVDPRDDTFFGFVNQSGRSFGSAINEAQNMGPWYQGPTVSDYLPGGSKGDVEKGGERSLLFGGATGETSPLVGPSPKKKQNARERKKRKEELKEMAENSWKLV